MTSKTAFQRFEAVSSGLNDAEVRSGLRLHDVAEEARPARASPRPSTAPGLRHVDRVVAEVGQPQVAQQQAAVGVRVGAHAPRRPSAPARRARRAGGRSRRTAPRAGSSASSRSSSCRCSGTVAMSRDRHLVRAPGAFDRLAVDLLRAGPALRACAGRSSASAGASPSPSPRACVWMRADLVEHRVERRRHQLVHRRRVVALDEVAARSRSRARAARARRAGCAPARSGRRSCSRSGAGSAARRRRAPGLRNLFECQLVASGPVSASPSPTTQATMRSGLSNAAPYACDSE